MLDLIKFLRFLLPRRCIFCQKGTRYDNRSYVCEKCKATLPYIKHACVRCGRPTGEHAILICADCRKNKHPFSGAFIPLLYEKEVRLALLRMKFYNAHYISRGFAILIAEKMLDSPMPDIDFITFVPSSEKQMQKRGYNQAELIARFLAQILHLPVIDSLIRLSDFPKQSSLSAAQRRINAKRSYISRNIFLSGTVLLVDDILTTGSTLDRCAHLLLKMGAHKVYIAACAASPKEYFQKFT